MTKIKIDSTLSGSADIALEHLRGEIYSKPGKRLVAVVEFAHTERTEPAPGEDKEPSVKLGVKLLEVARGEDQEDSLRKAMALLKLQRTAYGTFDEELQGMQLSESTLEDCAQHLAWQETARLRAALGLIADQVERLGNGQFTDRKRVEQLRKLAKVAQDAVHGLDYDTGGA